MSRERIEFLLKEIYKPYLSKIKLLYTEGVVLNNNQNYQHLFFSLYPINQINRLAYPEPNEATEEFLDPYVEEFAPVMRELEIVKAYLVRFLNRVTSVEDPHSRHLFAILPEALQQPVKGAYRPYYEVAVDKINRDHPGLIEEYRNSREYALIQKRLFIGGLHA